MGTRIALRYPLLPLTELGVGRAQVQAFLEAANDGLAVVADKYS
jgi:hypothetical protein